MNGVLPALFTNPNVYDTACLTTVVCSDTMKYVVKQHDEDPEKKFQEIIEAYNKVHQYDTERLFAPKKSFLSLIIDRYKEMFDFS